MCLHASSFLYVVQLKQKIEKKKYKSDCSPVSGSRLMVIIFGSFITMNCCNTSYKTKRIVEMIFCVIVVTQMKMQLNCILYRYSTSHYRISRKCRATWKLWFGTTVSVKKNTTNSSIISRRIFFDSDDFFYITTVFSVTNISKQQTVQLSRLRRVKVPGCRGK